FDHSGPVPGDGPQILGIRAEKLRLAGEGAGPIAATVAVVEKLGAETVIGCRLATGRDGDHLIAHDLVFVRLPGSVRVAVGTRCALDYAPADAVW
ncbi:TOBE domain-containing protein, partial [Mycobacterium tuberculosis]|nr:TOBE domain-containing protein [Mycobacterium tuberculosis]